MHGMRGGVFVLCAVFVGCGEDSTDTSTFLHSVDETQACERCPKTLPVAFQNDTGTPLSIVVFVNGKQRRMTTLRVIDEIEPAARRTIAVPIELGEGLNVPSLFLGANLPPPRLWPGADLDNEQVAASNGYIDLQSLTSATCVVSTNSRGRPSFRCTRASATR